MRVKIPNRSGWIKSNQDVDVDEVQSEFSQVSYTWLIPHLFLTFHFSLFFSKKEHLKDQDRNKDKLGEILIFILVPS
jgi:hypothetical protein